MSGGTSQTFPAARSHLSFVTRTGWQESISGAERGDAAMAGKGSRYRLGIWLAKAFLILLWLPLACSKTPSLVQARLHEWLPRSAENVISKSTGRADDITLITFTCSDSDLSSLRATFAMKNYATWKRAPLDERTQNMFKAARESLSIDPRLLPSTESPDLEFLSVTGAKPAIPVGEAAVIDKSHHRFWYVHSDM